MLVLNETAAEARLQMAERRVRRGETGVGEARILEACVAETRIAIARVAEARIGIGLWLIRLALETLAAIIA